MLAVAAAVVSRRSDALRIALLICIVGTVLAVLLPFNVNNLFELVFSFTVWQAAVGALWWLGAASEE